MHDPKALADRARRQGLRMTQQRATILQALCELDGHASAEKIHERVTEHQRDVDLSTVYRTLERLRDLRILSQTDLGRGCAEYELVTEQPHHHLVCRGCSRVIDLDHDYLAQAANAIRQDFGFEPVLDHFAIFGLCNECWNSGELGCLQPEPSQNDAVYQDVRVSSASNQGGVVVTQPAPDVLRILAHYNLGEFRDLARVDLGFVNEKWRIETTEGHYLLRRRHPSLSERYFIAAQHALMQHLQGKDFPVPAIIPTRSAMTVLELEDGVYEMQAFIAGTPCNSTNPAHLAEAARTLGRYHSAVSGFDHPALHRPSERYGPMALARILDQLVEDWQGRTSPGLERLIEELNSHAQSLAAHLGQVGRLPELVIHSDYYAGNLILQDDTVVGVVDYDLAHWCSRALEVAEALIAFAEEQPGRLHHIVYQGALNLDLVFQFLTAYAETARLSEVEIRALPHLVGTIWLCASLDPPLQPPLSRQAAPKALPEVLSLADWAQAHATQIVEIGLATLA
jgi:Fe2+ or Zn2+ uptake regulation protein/Ser/Thr protein kinase RdoA (MazF antagonist)